MHASSSGSYAPAGGGPRVARRGGCGCLGGTLLLALLILTPSLLIDVIGRTASARIVKKAERVQLSDDGGWQRMLQLAVTREATDYPGISPTVSVDEARFDRLRVGDTVRVRYVECCPIFARLSDRSTLDWLRDVSPWAVYEMRWFAWIVGGIAFLAFAGRHGPAYLIAAAIAWGVSGLALDRGTHHPMPNDGTARAAARVREVRRVEYALRSRDDMDFELNEPYDLVALAFVPAAGADTVVAVDGVDAESVRGLAVDSLVRVRFDPAAPRAATIDGGTRSYFERNRPVYLLILGGTFAVATLLGLLLSSKSLARRRRR